MVTSRKMQEMITELAAQHGIDLRLPGSYLRLEMPHYDPLVIEVLHEHLVNVAHVYEPYPGKNIADPGIAFFMGYDLWIPIEVTMRVGGYRIYAVLSPEMDSIVSILPTRQADLAEFAEIWADNIRDQHWLEEGVSEDVPF